MTCDFTFFLATFQSYQNDERLVMKGCVQGNSVFSWKDYCPQQGILIHYNKDCKLTPTEMIWWLEKYGVDRCTNGFISTDTNTWSTEEPVLVVGAPSTGIRLFDRVVGMTWLKSPRTINGSESGTVLISSCRSCIVCVRAALTATYTRIIFKVFLKFINFTLINSIFLSQ